MSFQENLERWRRPALAAARALRRQRPMDFRDRVALITGGSRGLGLLIARELAAEGARLSILARA